MENALGSHDVYFVLAETMQLVKIGFARSARDRLRAMQTNSPDQLRLLGVVSTDRAETLESELHAEFRKLRVRGEWFQATPTLLARAEEMCAKSASAKLAALRAVVEMD
jgi:hypothetical protein